MTGLTDVGLAGWGVAKSAKVWKISIKETGL